jgi:hypothetical protein
MGDDDRSLVYGVGNFQRMSRYDQGGCGGADCQSWGGHGFMKCMSEVGRLARESVPDTKIVVSTWYMDAEAWRSVGETLKARPGMADTIAMEEMTGVSASPLRDAASYGLPVLGFPSSEGISKDLTNAVSAQLDWSDRPAEETVKLEQGWFPSRGAKPQDEPGAEEASETVNLVDTRLTPQARRSWRQLYLRSLLDAELAGSAGPPNDAANGAFAGLIKIYHAHNAEPHVRPPLPQA